MGQKTVTINGKQYDAHTGMPVDTPNAQPQKNVAPILPQSEVHPSNTVHHTPQKSKTLNRRIVMPAAKQSAIPARTTVQKSSAITKFAPHPVGAKSKTRMSDIGPINHPMATKAHQRIQQSNAQKATPVAAAPKPSNIIKQEAIAQALDAAPSHKHAVKQVKKSKKHSRFTAIASASLALLLLGGYFAYLNMPSISVRVAAAQAGVNASYPEYRPDGYSLNGPVAYGKGEVVMKFAANAGPQNFSVTQAKSSWDSSAILDNYVKGKAGENYITYNERGLTIYTFGGEAAWVNGGILYTINGDAPLSSDQIRRIATSM